MDLYEVLGVSKSATKDEIKSAYRKLAKDNHPDAFATAPEAEKKQAEEKFKVINKAYEILSDDQKRAAYDRYGSENGPQGGFGGAGGNGGFSGFGGFGGGEGVGIDLEDIISSIFGGGFGGFGGRANTASRANAPRNGADIGVELTLTFEEAAFGVEKEINIKREETCPDCGGNGAKDGKAIKTCPQCNGTGTVNTVKNTPFGRVQTSGVCPQCGGKGKIVTETCKTCAGRGRVSKARTIKVSIPAGIDNGQTMTLHNEGNAGINGGSKGSLVIRIKVRTHNLFERRGSDLYMEMPITFVQAALGDTVSIKTLEKPVSYDIPAGTQSGTVFKIKGEGIKHLKKDSKGDLYVKIIVEVPKNLDKKQREIVKSLDYTFETKQHPQIKSYRDKLIK